jgi:hypothetical protein
MTLATFQSAFTKALLQAEPAATGHRILDALIDQPGFAVYRNTVMKGCIDALAANFPVVARLVGDEWFRAAATIFVRCHPPEQPSLIAYGGALPAFLETFQPAAELPYLADVARLDRAWTEAHIAADDARLAATVVAELTADELANVVLVPHATARWAWFADAPILSIWRANRDPQSATSPTELEWRAEGALLTRPHGQVEAVAVEPGDCAFLDACAAGKPVVEAATSALTAAPDCNLPALLQRLLRAGAFTRIAFPGSTLDTEAT